MVIKALEEHCVISYFEVAVSRGPSLAWVASLLYGEACSYQAVVIASACSAMRRLELPDRVRESRVRAGPGPGQILDLVRDSSRIGSGRASTGSGRARTGSGRAPGPGPGELPDQVRDNSRTGSGTAFGPSGKEGNELTAYCWPVKLIGGPALKL